MTLVAYWGRRRWACRAAQPGAFTRPPKTAALAGAVARSVRRLPSKANFSAAERSVTGERIRDFDADEIVAFARAFELPVTFFFMPPVPWAQNLPVRLETPDARPLGNSLAKMVDAARR